MKLTPILFFSLLLTFGLRPDFSHQKLGRHTEMAYASSFSPDGRWLATGSNDNHVIIWDVATGSQSKDFVAHSVGVKDLQFTPNGKYLVTAGLDNLIRVWNTKNWKREKELKGHSAQVMSIAISPDGRYLFSGGDDKKIVVWNGETFEKEREFEGQFDRVLSLNVSPNGKYLASTGGDRTTPSVGNLKIWRIEDGSLAFNLEEETYAIQDAAFSKGGTFVLYAGNFPEAVYLKWTEKKVAAKSKVSDFGINTVVLDGLQAYLGGTFDGSLIKWKIGGDKQTEKAHKSDINSISLHKGASKLASVDTDGQVLLWSLD